MLHLFALCPSAGFCGPTSNPCPLMLLTAFLVLASILQWFSSPVTPGVQTCGLWPTRRERRMDTSPGCLPWLPGVGWFLPLESIHGQKGKEPEHERGILRVWLRVLKATVALSMAEKMLQEEHLLWCCTGVWSRQRAVVREVSAPLCGAAHVAPAPPGAES